MRGKAVGGTFIDGPQDQQTIQVGGGYCTENGLVASVPQEILQQPWPVLLSGQRQADDGDRENNPSDGNHRIGNRGEDVPTACGAGQVDPGKVQPADPSIKQVSIKHHGGQGHGLDCHDGGYEPVTRLYPLVNV